MAVHRKRRGKKKLPSLRSVGHGALKSRKLSKNQLKQLRQKGYTYVTVGGRRRKITRANVRNGRIYYYKRSDTRKYAIRNFARDRAYPARRKAIKGKPYTGD